LLVIGGGIQTVQDWIAILGLTGAVGLMVTALLTIGVASFLTAGVLCLIWRYRGKLVRDHNLRLMRFGIPPFPSFHLLNALRIPRPVFRVELGGMRGVALTLAVVALGFGIAFAVVIVSTDDTPVWPESGAEYALPVVFGEKLDPDPETPGERSMTLLAGFADGARLDKVVLKNLDLGKSGLTDAFVIQRGSGVTGSNAYVWVGEVTITNSSARTLNWGNMELGTVSLSPKTDGHAQEITVDNTIPDLVIDSDRGSGTYTAEDSKVDRVILQINGNNGVSIGELIVDGVTAHTGDWQWDWLKAGKLTMDSSNEIGTGDGIDLSDANWANTIKARSITDSIIDTPISVR